MPITTVLIHTKSVPQIALCRLSIAAMGSQIESSTFAQLPALKRNRHDP